MAGFLALSARVSSLSAMDLALAPLLGQPVLKVLVLDLVDVPFSIRSLAACRISLAGATKSSVISWL